MRIQVITTNCALDAEARGAVTECFVEALGRRDRRISRVRVLLADLNGPRGGPAIACRAEVILRGRRRVFVEARDLLPGTAADAAAAMAVTAVTRALERRRERTRRPSWRGKQPLARGIAAAGAAG
jgi:putative sigma-54 modulation protein